MKKQINLIYFQMILSFLFIITVIVSILLSYNTALDLQKKATIFNKQLTIKISYFRSLLVFIITILFLYINYENKNIAIKKNENLRSYNLEIFASYFSIIASIITFYIIITSNDNLTVADIENPIN